jgi:MFS family permease
MYTDEDLYAAIKAGALDENAVASFRNYMESSRNTQAADEENFRLISGFNDIFVAIASLLLLVSAGLLAALAHPLLGFFVIAPISWGLSLYFVQKRKLALPAILLLGAYAVGVFGFFMTLLEQFEIVKTEAIMIACAPSAVMIWLHWLKFKVPITVAAGVVYLSMLVLSVFFTYLPEPKKYISIILMGCGLMSFAIAMYWDSQDTERKSRKSDVAFWLHLIASPLIIHPVFSSLDPTGRGASIAEFIMIICIYAILSLISIIIDRRALMVSALIYVIAALAKLFESYGSMSNSLAASGVFIGAALLFLSAAWHPTRARLLTIIPQSVKKYLPSTK